MEHCFKQNELVILGINNEAMINDVLYRFIDHLLMLFDIDHFVEEANFLSQKSYKTDEKAIIISIQNLDKQCRVSLFPTKKQNPDLTINVFRWENDHVIVYRISEKDSAIPRIN